MLCCRRGQVGTRAENSRVVNPSFFFLIFLLLGLLRIPFMLYGRQQIRNNPARQTAGTEDITFRSTILLRFKNPGRLLFPQHWYYGKASPIELIVRRSTFQVTRWGIGRRSRHYAGWFLQSSETTMWVATMRFFPLGQQECIVVAGSYPWRNGERQVELAMGTQGRSAEIWAALLASGVRPLQQPEGTDAAGPPPAPAPRELQGITYGIPRPGYGTPPAAMPPMNGYQAPVAPASPGAAAAYGPSPYVPNFESPAGAAATRSRIARRTVLTVGVVLCLPLLAVFILAHSDLGHRQQTGLAVELTGPPTVATVSGASCIINGDDVDVAGVISAAAAAPSGLTVSAALQTGTGGPGVGLAAQVTIPQIAVGEPQTFSGVIAGAAGDSATDRCVITWVATTPAAPS
jgi:hypothetical protein